MAKSTDMNGEEPSSKRHFHWTTKISNNEDEDESTPSFKSLSEEIKDDKSSEQKKETGCEEAASRRRKLQTAAISRLRFVLTAFGKKRQQSQRVVFGTLFGNKRGFVHFAFQKDPKLEPALLIQLTTPITGLVREMSTGLVRIVLESEKKEKKNNIPLIEERVWRTYCNGIKCGLATRMECGEKQRKILKAVEPISMGAGVLPETTEEEEVIYMRAKFERVIGSTDSEALYMVNPDSKADPELSIYLLRL